MTDPQLPPPSGAVPPAPDAFPAPEARPGYPAAPQPAAAFPPAPPAPGYPAAPAAAPAYPPAQPAPSVPQAPAGYPQTPAPQAPPGAYQVPVGGYVAPQGGYVAPQTAAPTGGFLGILSLILGGVAAIIIPIIAGIAGFEIGVRIPSGIDTTDPDFLSALSPARTQVLWAEIAFWVGTALGIAAIVVGIIAIRKKQRRALGIVGMVLAVLGAAIFWIVLVATLSAGMATGFVNY